MRLEESTVLAHLAVLSTRPPGAELDGSVACPTNANGRMQAKICVAGALLKSHQGMSSICLAECVDENLHLMSSSHQRRFLRPLPCSTNHEAHGILFHLAFLVPEY